MGFRSTMTTGDLRLDIPQDFLDKHPYLMCKKLDDGRNVLPLTLKSEIKFYYAFEDTELFKDIQKLIIDQSFNSTIDLVLLHECGGITKVEISKDSIVGIEPTHWKRVTGVEHNYCYGCSDIKKVKEVDNKD